MQTSPHIVTAPICHHLKPKLEQREGNVGLKFDFSTEKVGILF